MHRYFNPKWQELRNTERAAFGEYRAAQSKITRLLSKREIPAAEDVYQVFTRLRNWNDARREIDAWMASWLDTQEHMCDSPSGSKIISQARH